MKNNKLDNKGMTLIELVVIIAIMAVLTASFAVSITLISKQRVSNAANDLKSTIQLAQTYAKSRGSCWLEIIGTENGSNSFIMIEKDGVETIGNGPNNINKKITTQVEFVLSDGTTQTITLSEGMGVQINIDRSTGGFMTSYVYSDANDINVSGTTPLYTGVPQRIIFSNGEKESVLWLATNTGLVTFESQKD